MLINVEKNFLTQKKIYDNIPLLKGFFQLFYNPFRTYPHYGTFYKFITLRVSCQGVLGNFLRFLLYSFVISKKCCIFAVAIPRRGMSARHRRRVADIFKRRLLTLCSDVFETSQLSKASSGLSNDRCPTGYRLSLLCLLRYSICVYTYAHTRTLTM